MFRTRNHFMKFLMLIFLTAKCLSQELSRTEKTFIACGQRNPNGVGPQVASDNNNQSKFGEFPWMVGVLYIEKINDQAVNIYKCGGALIAPNVVVTAAHCVTNRGPELLKVRAGEWDTQIKTEILPHQQLGVKEVIVHELFHEGVRFNDIALLILEGEFELEDNVRPICLPPVNATFDFSRCFATGWGKDQFGKKGTYQSILKKLELPVVPHGQCQSALRNTRLGQHFNLDESLICAGGEKDKFMCEGDDGSPLVCPIPDAKDRYYHVGIVVDPVDCFEQNVPGLYGNVPFLRQWIDGKLGQLGIDFQYFTP